jgi:hypothetical protein
VYGLVKANCWPPPCVYGHRTPDSIDIGLAVGNFFKDLRARLHTRDDAHDTLGLLTITLGAAAASDLKPRSHLLFSRFSLGLLSPQRLTFR